MKDQQELFEKIWGYVINRIERLYSEGVSQTEMAKRVGIARSTLQRYMVGDRGERVPMTYVIKMIKGLEVSMSELAVEIGEPELAVLLEVLISNPEEATQIAAIYTHGGAARRKLQAEIAYIYESLKKQ